MGAGQSVEETADEDQGISFRVKSTDQQRQEYTSAGEEEFGSFHVLQVEDNSPAAGKLLPFLDFITAVNAKKLVCMDCICSRTYSEPLTSESV
jgi:hypothetical protein